MTTPSARPPFEAVRILKYLHLEHHDKAQHYHNRWLERKAFLASIPELAEPYTGYIWRQGCDGDTTADCVAVVWGGMDCDGSQYSGNVCYVRATVRDLEQHFDDKFSSADGPCGFTLMKPSEASQIRYRSRDLGLEAFENGHPHVLRP